MPTRASTTAASMGITALTVSIVQNVAVAINALSVTVASTV